MRRNIRRHADGDAVRAIDQQVGERGGEHARLLLAFIVIRLEIDRILVDIVQQQHRRRVQPHFGITHRRRHIAVDRAEIPLPVDQRQAHREILRHTHGGQINRAVAMRMVFTHHVTGHTRGFAVRLVGRVAGLVHRVQNPPMHRLQPIPRIRQRAGDDNGHRIVQIGLAHLLLDRDRLHPARRFGAAAGFVGDIVHVRSCRRGRRRQMSCRTGGNTLRSLTNLS